MKPERDIETFPWINEYFTLAKSLPNILYSCRGRNATAAEIADIKAIVAARPNIVLEIGAGSGQHLMRQAKRHPELQFIGIEIRYKRAVRLAQKTEKEGINNLFVIRADAACIETLFDPQTIKGLYINFPDPWARPKERKKRLLAPSFIDTYAKLLCPNGFIRLKTDHKEFFESSYKLLMLHPLFTVTEKIDDLHQSDKVGQNIQTEFEQLFISQKLPIYFLECCRSVAQI